MEKTEKVWMNGQFVDWDDAKVHVLSHVIHYGTGIFEGIRCYNTSELPHAKAVRLPASTTDSIPLRVTEVLCPQASIPYAP